MASFGNKIWNREEFKVPEEDDEEQQQQPEAENERKVVLCYARNQRGYL